MATASKPPRPPLTPRIGQLGIATALVKLAEDDVIEDANHVPALAAATSRGVEVDQTMFSGGTIAGSRWQRTRWVDVELDGVDAANAKFDDAELHRTRWTRCRGTGASFGAAVMEDATFEGCKLDLSGWRFAKLTKVHFKGCQLDQADFSGARLWDVCFEDCSLNGATFLEGRVRDVRIERCPMVGVGGVQALRGATIAGAEALSLTDLLADALGITLER